MLQILFFSTFKLYFKTSFFHKLKLVSKNHNEKGIIIMKYLPLEIVQIGLVKAIEILCRRTVTFMYLCNLIFFHILKS